MTHTIRLRCPVTLEWYSDFDMEPCLLDGTADRAKEINRMISQDGFFSANQAMYLADWDQDGEVLEDVRFDVVYEDYQLWGRATIQTSRALTETEETDLIDDITGQFSDGWGESFEQNDIRGDAPYDRYYCKFWSSEPWWALTRCD